MLKTQNPPKGTKVYLSTVGRLMFPKHPIEGTVHGPSRDGRLINIKSSNAKQPSLWAKSLWLLAPPKSLEFPPEVNPDIRRGETITADCENPLTASRRRKKTR